ncbi:MAG: S46 family peptidase [Rhizobiaceae bacterium]
MRIRIALAAVATVMAGAARADEGFFTYDAIPVDAIKASTGFAPDQAWLDHLRLSSVRLDGCSASIVSGEGLVQTNHHCVTECIESLSTPGQDLEMTPILAPTQADEKICPGMTAEVLVDLKDVTSEVTAAGEGEEGRRQAIGKIEEACSRPDDHRRCEVVAMFSGAKYLNHVYREWSDVRLVLGPEGAAGSFGGDPDNFNFPRFAFDIAYLRLYDDGKPAVTPNHLKWRSEPLKDGEPVFISGHPWDTGRSMPAAVIDIYLDTYFPWVLVTDAELRGRLIALSAQGAEQARQLMALLYDVENNYKSNWGEHAALAAGGIAAGIHADEARLKEAIAADPKLTAEAGDVFERLFEAESINRQIFYARRYFGTETLPGSELFQLARALYWAGEEKLKPEDDRLPGYSDAEIAELRDHFAQEGAVSDLKEEVLISFWLSKMREFMTADHPTVKRVLGKESPEGLAARIVTSTRLRDPAERLRLFDGGKAAVDASDELLFQLVKAIDADAREIARRYRDEVAGPIMAGRRTLDAIRDRLSAGKLRYPDANATLRLNFGRVEGWIEPDGRPVTPFTTFGGLIDRQTGAPPFKLAPLWEAAKDKLTPETILNVSTNNDTIGGNSGSPAVDSEGRLVGAMFDGNIHSLGGYYMFDPVRNRSVIVAATALEEGLAKVYGLQRIVDELKR